LVAAFPGLIFCFWQQASWSIIWLGRGLIQAQTAIEFDATIRNKPKPQARQQPNRNWQATT
jgi:hypothetical protein